MARRLRIFGIILCMALTAGVAGAQDGLYAPVLPGDTALVRVVNLSGDPVTIDAGATRIGPVPPESASPYHPTRPGVYVIFAAADRVPLTVTARSFHTILVSDEGLLLAEDTRHDDPLRAQLILYNLSSSPVRLDAVIPEGALIPAVEPGKSAQIAINAIPVTVAAIAEGGTATTGSGSAPDREATRQSYRAEIELERGDSYAVVVTDTSAGLGGLVVTASVTTAE